MEWKEFNCTNKLCDWVNYKECVVISITQAKNNTFTVFYKESKDY